VRYLHKKKARRFPSGCKVNIEILSAYFLPFTFARTMLQQPPRKAKSRRLPNSKK